MKAKTCTMHAHRPAALNEIGRRTVLGGLLGITLSGCMTTRGHGVGPSAGTIEPAGRQPAAGMPAMYAAVDGEPFPVPAVPADVVPGKFWRQEVADPTGEAPGTIVVDTAARYLYLVQPAGRAIRYGVGIGRAGFGWQGRAVVAWKRAWPKWTPPAAMIEREPHLEKYRDGMAPGLDNPLGARALYIHENGVDTLYRLHGTNEPESIGNAVSSGCIRLLNQDVIDLYERVEPPAPIVVRHSRPLAV